MYNKEAEQAVWDALEIGFWLIDTAALYKNEREIGNAVRQSGLLRNKIFVTTKVGDSYQGYDSTPGAFETSLQKLNLEYVDLHLVHWPVRGKRKDTWLALEKLYAEKRVKAIGAANYLVSFLEELNTYASVAWILDQVGVPHDFFKKICRITAAQGGYNCNLTHRLQEGKNLMIQDC